MGFKGMRLKANMHKIFLDITLVIGIILIQNIVPIPK